MRHKLTPPTFLNRFHERGLFVVEAVGDEEIKVAKHFYAKMLEETHGLSPQTAASTAEVVIPGRIFTGVTAFLLIHGEWPLGVILCQPSEGQPWESIRTVNVFGLYVRPEDRSLGISLPLLKACYDYANKIGASRLEFTTKQGGRLTSIYKRLGYKQEYTTWYGGE